MNFGVDRRLTAVECWNRVRLEGMRVKVNSRWNLEIFDRYKTVIRLTFFKSINWLQIIDRNFKQFERLLSLFQTWNLFNKFHPIYEYFFRNCTIHQPGTKKIRNSELLFSNVVHSIESSFRIFLRKKNLNSQRNWTKNFHAFHKTDSLFKILILDSFLDTLEEICSVKDNPEDSLKNIRHEFLSVREIILLVRLLTTCHTLILQYSKYSCCFHISIPKLFK